MPQLEQNLALGGLLVPQLEHTLACWLAPHSGQNLLFAGICALQL